MTRLRHYYAGIRHVHPLHGHTPLPDTLTQRHGGSSGEISNIFSKIISKAYTNLELFPTNINFKDYIIYDKMKCVLGFICTKFMLDPSRSAPAPAFRTLRFITLSSGRHRVSGKGVCP